MNNKFILSLCLTISMIYNLLGASDKALTYIEKYKDVAVLEMKKSGIPASIKLAQGMIESSWGESNLAKEANNHFGIKCGGNWQGPTYFKVDDDFDTNGKNIESCFRVYKDANESYMSHTDFLTDPAKKSRYGFLFQYNTTDYVSWAYGLKTAGYATDPSYPKKLIQVIEKFNLSAFDENISITDKENNKILANNAKPSTDEMGNNSKVASNKILKKNDLACIYANGNESLLEIAKRVNIPARTLLAINETITVAQENVPANAIIYLEKKHRDYEGEEDQHLVKKGETLEEISQIYGLKVTTLRSINKMTRKDHVNAGDIILLKPNKKSKRDSQKERSGKDNKKKKDNQQSEYLFEL